MRTKYHYCCAILLCTLILIGLQPLCVSAAPTVYTKYYCLVDGETGQPIIAKNPNTLRPIASTTKIMTAILALEYGALDDIAIVSQKASITPEYSIGLRTGQKVSVEELLKVSLIKSSNDAAVVLAENVAGDEEFFAHLMSLKAFAIGAMNTHFKNASGLPQNGAYSTAYDLCEMGRYALDNPVIRKLVSTKQTTFKHPGYLKPMTIRNTNALIETFPGATGIKTGTADEAGKCLIASATRGNRKLIAVVLKSGDRAGDCARLLNYGYKNTERYKIIDSKEEFKSVKINNGRESYASIVPEHDLWIWQGDNIMDIQKKVRMNYWLEAPLPAGYKVGEMDIYVEGKYCDSINLVTKKAVQGEPGILYKTFKKFFAVKENLNTVGNRN